MDPKQTSFIPRKSATDTRFEKKATAGIFNLICAALFIVAVMASAGVFMYNRMLNSAIVNKQAELADYQEQIRSEVVQNIKKTAARMDAAENRLGAHLALSSFMEDLGDVTLRNIRWKNFRFQEEGGRLQVVMDGEARSFASVALQADKISETDIFTSPLISNLSLSENGGALFAFRTFITPEAANYRISVIEDAVEIPVVEPAPVETQAAATSSGTSTAPRGGQPLNTRP
ncbi:MAG TPA: hypothetical protein PLF31_03295 [Candidatus Paceibacterota bacterium]|nr:hypothetical protein [Candidatus Paceibacterota bacterium]